MTAMVTVALYTLIKTSVPSVLQVEDCIGANSKLSDIFFAPLTGSPMAPS